MSPPKFGGSGLTGLDGPIHANRFADSRESPDSRESRQGSRTDPLLLRIALRGARNCESFLSLFFCWKKARKTTKKQGFFCPCRTPKIPGKEEGKTLKKQKKTRNFFSQGKKTRNSKKKQGKEEQGTANRRFEAIFIIRSNVTKIGFFCESIRANQFARVAPIRVANRRAI